MKLGLEAGKHTYELAARHGIKGVPIQIDELVGGGVETTLRPIRERDLEVCQIGAMGFNPLSPDADLVLAQKKLLEKGIPLAAAAGCRVIAISCGSYAASAFGGSHRGNYGDEAITEMAEAIKPFLDLAEKHDVLFSIEPYIKGVIHTPEAFDKLAGAVGSAALRINLDVTNFYDLRDLIDPTDRCASVIPAVKGKVGIVHVKDIALREGFHIHAELAPITDGATDWKAVLEGAAAVVPDDTWVLLEHVMSPEEGDASIAHLRGIASELGLELK